jgi:hypothetical protein
MKDALELASKLGIGGGVGFLLGWLIVCWIEPATGGGVALLIILSVVLCSTIGGILSKIVGRKSQKNGQDEKQIVSGSEQSSGRKDVAMPVDSWTC